VSVVPAGSWACAMGAKGRTNNTARRMQRREHTLGAKAPVRRRTREAQG